MAEPRAHGNLHRNVARHGVEVVEQLASSGDVVIERIVSTGQSTPPGEWLEQARDEWVVLIEGDAELVYDDGSRLRLSPGDHVLISAGARHRVEWTREDPPCIWVAVRASGLTPPRASDE